MAYQKGIETRTRILQGSKELFLSEGYNESTFKKIGEYLNVNSNLITYYFSNKKALASYTLIDYFQASNALVSRYLDGDETPMFHYAMINRIHYKTLAQNEGLLRFYAQAVTEGLLHQTFSRIPFVNEQYLDFFPYYGLKMEYPEQYYLYMETASEREIMLHFTPELEKDEHFIPFVASIFPRMIRLPEEFIDSALAKSKDLIDKVDVSNFEF